jgi:hypothetical protein
MRFRRWMIPAGPATAISKMFLAKPIATVTVG